MNNDLLIAIVGGTISIVVAILSQVLIRWKEFSIKAKEEQKRIRREYLSPLRLFLAENHVRLSEIINKIELDTDHKCIELLQIDDVSDISTKDIDWFNGYGCYLISSSYLTACLFSYMNNVRNGIPYVDLMKREDAKLLTYLTRVSIGFLDELGIFYVTQFSIGREMFNRDEQRVLSYREFCEHLQKGNNLLWYSRLINYYLDTGKGLHCDRVYRVLKAIDELSNYLDELVGGGESLIQRYNAEFMNIEEELQC